MAQQGMFGNYQQQLADETALRKQSAQTGGLTGWAAITNAMSGIGSEFGYSAGKAFGGMTPVEAEQARFESVMDSVNYDPTNPDSMMEASAALNAAGFYDKGLEMFNLSNKVKSDNLLVEVKEIELENLKNPKREMITLGDDRVYYRDTLELVKPDLEVPEEELTTTEQIAFDKAERNKLATALVSSMPVTTSAEIQSVANVLRSGGYADTAQYKDLMRNLTTRLSYESTAEKEVTDVEQQAAKVETADVTLRYKPVMEVGKGVALVDGFFLDNAPAGKGNEDRAALSKQIGGLIETYDNTLSTDRGAVSPGEAVAFYERALSLPEVYEANQQNFQGINPAEWFKGSKFSSEAFRTTLDKSFSRNGQSVSGSELFRFANAGLIIPGVTVIDMGGGNVGTITAQGLAEYLANDIEAIPTGG